MPFRKIWMNPRAWTGPSNFRIFIEIIMPLSKPIVAVVALFFLHRAAGGFHLSPAPFCAPRTNTPYPSGFITWWRKKMGASYTTYAAGRGTDCCAGRCPLPGVAKNTSSPVLPPGVLKDNHEKTQTPPCLLFASHVALPRVLFAADAVKTRPFKRHACGFY